MLGVIVVAIRKTENSRFACMLVYRGSRDQMGDPVAQRNVRQDADIPQDSVVQDAVAQMSVHKIMLPFVIKTASREGRTERRFVHSFCR